MKKILFAAAIFAVVGLASCNKERTCTCTTTMDGQVMGTTEGTIKGKCSELDTETTTMGITSKVTCEKK